MSDIAVTYVGGPTALLEYAGVRFIIDPTFDLPQVYAPRKGLFHTKTVGPALTVSELGRVDAALLSHHHHRDNLDILGLEMMLQLPAVISTTKAHEDLGDIVVGLEPWQETHLSGVSITAVPALHGPPGSESRGPVIGFVLRAEGCPDVYISGDNASLDIVKSVRDAFGVIPISVLFAGAAMIPTVDGRLTMSASDAVVAAEILGSTTIVGLHTEDWVHLTESRDDLRRAFAEVVGYTETPRGVRVLLN